MLHTDIAVVLPLGVTRPVYARLAGTRRPSHWVRAGELHHSAEGVELRPPWDGKTFSLIWQAARRQPTGSEGGAGAGPEVLFAVHVGRRLVPVARVELTRTVLRQLRWSR